MVVNERAVGGVDEVVRGGVAGGRGEGGDEGHLRGRWRTEGEKGGEEERDAGMGLGPTADRGQCGTTFGRIYVFRITQRNLYNVQRICAVWTL